MISRCLRFGLELVEQRIEAPVVPFPQTAIAFQPLGSFSEPLGLEAARPPLRVAAARNQAGALQHLQVLGDRRLAHRERLGQLRHRRLTRRQAGEDRPPGGIGEGREDGVEAVCRLHNLLVIYGRTRLPSSPRGCQAIRVPRGSCIAPPSVRATSTRCWTRRGAFGRQTSAIQQGIGGSSKGRETIAPVVAQSTRRSASNPATGHWAMNTDATSMCPSRRARSVSASLMLDTRTCALGYAHRNAARRSSMTEVYNPSSPCANSRSEAPSLAAPRALVTARPAAVSVPRASTRKASPAGVSRIPRGRRWNSVTPTSRSRSRICFESAGCATRSRPAARRKLPSSETATKYLRCRSSTQVNPCSAVSTNRWMKPIAIPERA